MGALGADAKAVLVGSFGSDLALLLGQVRALPYVLDRFYSIFS